MGGVDRITDIAGLINGDEGYAKPQTATNATWIVGAEIDLQPVNAGVGYQSALIICPLAFTSSSGNSTGTVTVAIQPYDDTVTGMGTEATYGSAYSYVYTWAADGANIGVHCFPVQLKGANRFFRAKFKITKGGTITVASELCSIAVVLGGQKISPDSTYSTSGYETTTEAA